MLKLDKTKLQLVEKKKQAFEIDCVVITLDVATARTLKEEMNGTTIEGHTFLSEIRAKLNNLLGSGEVERPGMDK